MWYRGSLNKKCRSMGCRRVMVAPKETVMHIKDVIVNLVFMKLPFWGCWPVPAVGPAARRLKN